MFFLVPALVVGVATIVRVLFAGAGTTDSARDGMVRPLIWIYAGAPLVGAAGTISRTLSMGSADTAESLLLPLGWGIAAGLGALVAFIMTGAPQRGKSIGGWLIITPGLLALAIAAVIVAVSNRPSFHGTNLHPPTLSVSSLHQGDRSLIATPVLEVAEGRYTIDGQGIESSDIVFRLAGVAARSESIIVKMQKNQPASDLQDALALVNQAGFVHVGIDSEPAPKP